MASNNIPPVFFPNLFLNTQQRISLEKIAKIKSKLTLLERQILKCGTDVLKGNMLKGLDIGLDSIEKQIEFTCEAIQIGRKIHTPVTSLTSSKGKEIISQRQPGSSLSNVWDTPDSQQLTSNNVWADSLISQSTSEPYYASAPIDGQPSPAQIPHHSASPQQLFHEEKRFTIMATDLPTSDSPDQLPIEKASASCSSSTPDRLASESIKLVNTFSIETQIDSIWGKPDGGFYALSKADSMGIYEHSFDIGSLNVFHIECEDCLIYQNLLIINFKNKIIIYKKQQDPFIAIHCITMNKPILKMCQYQNYLALGLDNREIRIINLQGYNIFKCSFYKVGNQKLQALGINNTFLVASTIQGVYFAKYPWDTTLTKLFRTTRGRIVTNIAVYESIAYLSIPVKGEILRYNLGNQEDLPSVQLPGHQKMVGFIPDADGLFIATETKFSYTPNSTTILQPIYSLNDDKFTSLAMSGPSIILGTSKGNIYVFSNP